MSGELITEGPEYDPADPYHVRLWELAGRPDTAEDGWRPTITLILQPGGAYERRDLPMQNPLTDVERLAQGVALYRAANEAAKEIILTLMVKVSGAMINLEVVNAASEPITADNANDEGARFVAYHREAIVDYKQAGRNQVAANALYAAVSSEGSLTAFPWLEASGGIILGIFASELGVTP